MRVHYIDYIPGTSIVFFPGSKRFFKINNDAKKLISDMISGQSKQDIMFKYNINEEKYNTYHDNIFNKINGSTKEKCKHDGLKTLDRLVLNIANDCNMRCRYCYADGGHYKSNRDLMEKRVAERTLELFFSYFDKIHGIQFFGGEPLLNIDVMEYVCEYLESKRIETNFGVVTNGTIMNSKFLNLIKKYNISVTVSYDGHPKIHDLMRPLANGNKSSSLIIKNMKRLYREANALNVIQGTYTQHHVENNITPLNISDSLQEEFPRTFLHLSPAGGMSNLDFVLQNLDVFPESVKRISERVISLENFRTFSLIDRIFISLSQKDTINPLICDAGFGTLSVSSNGDVYPCFMFTDMEELRIGNIFDKNVFESKQAKIVVDKLIAFSVKENNKDCKNCIIKEICTGCLGLNDLITGNPFMLSKKLCEMQKKMVSNVIVESAKIIDKNESGYFV